MSGSRVFVDADACPVRDEVVRVAGRLGAAVSIVSNGSRPIRPSREGFVEMVVVGVTPDAADDWIAERIGPLDVCVTADIPLAQRCLARGARAVSPRGMAWTDDNIGSAVAGRAIGQHLRETGVVTGGPSALTARDRSKFVEALDRAIREATRPRVRGLGGLRHPEADG